jgi:hypothetical protein
MSIPNPVGTTENLVGRRRKYGVHFATNDGSMTARILCCLPLIRPAFRCFGDGSDIFQDLFDDWPPLRRSWRGAVAVELARGEQASVSRALIETNIYLMIETNIFVCQ